MADEDTEITLGAGKLLGLFFMLAAVCGIFFAVGFSLGKTAAKEQALQERSAETHSGTNSSEISGSKPSAVEPLNAPAAANDGFKEPEPDLTFYKAVKQNGQELKEASVSKPGPATSEAQRAEDDSAKKTQGVQPMSEPPSQTIMSARAISPSSAPAQSMPTAVVNGSFLVQIAAVTHEEDAAALAGALRKKSYAAAVVNNPTGKDKLYHVVLGPYVSLQAAEAMKLKLQGEGYNPIVKR